MSRGPLEPQIHMNPTERRINQLLSDGKPHLKEEIHACLYDELSDIKTIRYHISTLRKVVRLLGEEIICEFANRRIMYRKVRLLVPQETPTH